MHYDEYKRCIDACYACAAECEHCATECLKENDTTMLSLCIALTRECAIVCDATARLLSVGADNATLICSACFEICSSCADECESDSKELEYCKRCAEICRMCADECRNVAEQYAATVLSR
jgi:hypothetical protein